MLRRGAMINCTTAAQNIAAMGSRRVTNKRRTGVIQRFKGAGRPRAD
jgi:hypothetical protein